MKQQSFKLTLIELTFASGKSEIRAMSPAQLAGIKKSNERKEILSKRKLAVLDINLKILKQPL